MTTTTTLQPPSKEWTAEERFAVIAALQSQWNLDSPHRYGVASRVNFLLLMSAGQCELERRWLLEGLEFAPQESERMRTEWIPSTEPNLTRLYRIGENGERLEYLAIAWYENGAYGWRAFEHKELGIRHTLSDDLPDQPQSLDAAKLAAQTWVEQELK